MTSADQFRSYVEPLQEIAGERSSNGDLNVPTRNVPLAAIGVGRPLSILIHSIYPGKRSDKKDLLITSAVKNPLLEPAGVVGINYAFTKVESGRFLSIDGADRGTTVVYYTQSLAERKLNISVKLTFDGFDRGAAAEFIDKAVGIASLPAFLAGGSLGPTGAAGAQALVKVVGAAARVVISVVDNFIDVRRTTHLSGAIAIADPGSPRAKPGYKVLAPDFWPVRPEDDWDKFVWGEGAEVQSDDDADPDRIRPQDFFVDDRGELHHVNAPEERFQGDFPYVVLKVDGTAYAELKKWKPAVVAAALAARFLGRADEADVATEITDAFEAYSDYSLIKNAADLDRQSKRSVSAKEKAELIKRRDALLDEIQDPDLKEAVS